MNRTISFGSMVLALVIPALAEPPTNTPPYSAASSLHVVIENNTKGLPLKAELVPLKQLAIFRNDSKYTWDKPELTPVDLSTEHGKIGVALQYTLAEKDGSGFIGSPTLEGKDPLATSHNGFTSVFLVSNTKTRTFEGYMLGGSGTFTFIWLVNETGSSLPLRFTVGKEVTEMTVAISGPTN